MRKVKEIETFEQTRLAGRGNQKETIYIGWKHPHRDWIKLNCDGAYKGSLNIAGCGGLFRDSDGQWLQGYTQRIGACDALHAEMWGMYTGMQVARRQGYTNLIVESDSKFLIDMVTGSCKLNGNTPILVRRIQDLSKLQWHVIFMHTWREGNRCADWLASYSLNQSSYDVSILEVPPRELQNLLFDDFSGACMPRSVSVTL
jgi:ribonuclease HI